MLASSSPLRVELIQVVNLPGCRGEMALFKNPHGKPVLDFSFHSLGTLFLKPLVEGDGRVHTNDMEEQSPSVTGTPVGRSRCNCSFFL